MGQKRKQYTREFKLEAVEQSYKRTNIRQLAEDLDISVKMIYKWRASFCETGALSFPGNGSKAQTPDEQRVTTLERENEQLRTERDILKKAVGIFSKHHG